MLLEVKPSGKQLVVFYVADGLSPDDGDEAWSIGTVPVEHAVASSSGVDQRCRREGTKSARLLNAIHDPNGKWGGLEGFMRDVRERGDEVIDVLKEGIADRWL